MFVSRPRFAYIVALVAAAPLILFLTYTFFLREFHRVRIQAFLGLVEDPLGVSYQPMQAKISIGSGGMFGFGLSGGALSQLDLLGVRTSDFVFAHASSMFGFVGMVALLACFVILLLRVLRVAEISSDTFGQCMAAGIAAVLFFQAIVNIGMNLGLLPVAGIPLPFVSLGVSSLWTFLIAEGILQSILMHHRKLAFQRE
jgi:rod shape determining protein RodA